MPFPSYSIHSETAEADVDEASLHAEVAALGIVTATFRGVRVLGAKVTVLFDGAPSSEDQVLVTAAVASHRPAPVPVTMAHYTLIGTSGALSVPSLFGDLGGIVADVGAIVRVPASAVLRVRGELRTALGAAALRIVRGGGEVVSSEFQTTTGGAYAKFSFATNQPLAAGEESYRLQGRLASALTSDIRFVSFSLVANVPRARYAQSPPPW